MGTDRAEEHSLAAEEPAEQTVGSALPAIAANDLEEIKKAVEDAASISGGLWLSYLFVLSYIAIAAGAVTHEDLLLVRAVKLPFLNVELPLKAFFVLAPFIVLIIHAYALMHFIMLGKKASRFHNELRRQFPDSDRKSRKSGAAPDGTQKEVRDKRRWLLPSNIFVQILAGPRELRTGFFGFMLKLIALTTLVLFPILLLLLLQIQFLPFHDVKGNMRDEALKRIEILDCDNPDKNLASCDPAKPPSDIFGWQQMFSVVSVDEAAFARAVAIEWRSLVCARDTNAIHILRGILRGQWHFVLPETAWLVDFIMSKDCPVSASLTDDDKAKLLKIKQEVLALLKSP